MPVLAIDTSSSITAVALVEGARVLSEDDSPSEHKHGETLLPRVQQVLKAGGVELAQLQAIAVGVGPGSFTGLRVGLATAKGLSLATGTPIRGVSSLRVLARGLHDDGGVGDRPLLTVLDAHKGEVFVAGYRAGEGGALTEVLAPLHAEPAEAARRVRQALGGGVVCGDGARRYEDTLRAELPGFALADAAHDAPRGRHVAAEALRALALEGPSDLTHLEPSYLRGSDARLPDEPLKTS
jgi:tRNA threonylcarbamoyladenosine biosynthesis protein TsaB